MEYDLENSTKDDLRITSSDRIEQSAVPQCMTWYPPITKEHFVLTANDQVRKYYQDVEKEFHLHDFFFEFDVMEFLVTNI